MLWSDNMSDKETPFIDAILQYITRGITPFHTPGHIQGRGVSEKFLEFWRYSLSADLAEVYHEESNHDYEVPRRESEELLAKLYGAERSFFLCNGTTEGIHALCLSFFQEVHQDNTVLLPRNAHRSLMGGLILTGAKPKWVYPKVDSQWMMATVVETKDWIEESNGVTGAFHLYPNYYGLCQDLGEQVIPGVPNLVDEAHGPHLGFANALPKPALHYPINATVQSTHKILSSLTQSSWLHVKTKDDVYKVENALGLIESTSPNFLLWASLDGARAFETGNSQRWEETIERVLWLRDQIAKIPGIEVFKPTDEHVEIKAYDPLKILVSAQELGLNGFALRDELRQRGVMPELSEANFVLLLITPAHSQNDLDLLINSLQDIASQRDKIPIIQKTYPVYPRLKMINTPKEAFFSKSFEVKLEDANGYVSAEMIIPYPPGIPLIYPGEEVTKEVIELVQYYRSLGWPLRGIHDQRAEVLRVLV